MRNPRLNQANGTWRTGNFAVTLGQFATVLFLILPCAAQNPPGVLYSTTLPGSAAVNAVAVDASNNVYVVGNVGSAGLEGTPGALQPSYTGGTCVLSGNPTPTGCAEPFIAKFNSTGALVFLTYLGGGSSYELPYAAAVDASGNIYVGGTTTSTDFPLAGSPWRPTPSAADGFSFLAKISGDGTKLIWSTVISGGPVQLALTPAGDLDVLTESPAPTLTQLTNSGQFVTSANVPMDSNSLAVGADGSVYLAGNTYPDGVPDVTATPGAWQTTYGGGQSDGFVAKLNPDLSGFAWLTFVGGSGGDDLNLLALAPDGSLWVSGGTTSSNFPVNVGGLEPSAEEVNGFLVHLSADGSKALASTYIPFLLTNVAADSSANVVFSGSVVESTFPATPGAQVPCPPFVPANPPAIDNYVGFFGKIDPAGQHVLWGTWLGPSVPNGMVAVDTHGNAIAAGNLPGQTQITLSALSTSNMPHLVESCIDPSALAAISSPLAPGELFSIYGADYGPAQGVVAQPSGGAIGTSRGGIQVRGENTPVPLLYVSQAQINAVAPFLLQGRTAAHIKIVTPSGTSNEVVLGVREVVPEIFAISNQDGTQNSQTNPAHAGDYLAIWTSGMGQTSPPGVDGAIPLAAGGTPLAPIALQLATVQSPNLEIPGPTPPPPIGAQILYAGNAPGLVSGVTQINFEMPELSYPIWSEIPIIGPPYAAFVMITIGSASVTTYLWFE
jgi:uncharacterized protein (TIGR03437 family)